MNLKRLSDGIPFQFLMVGSLSFSHIHDVVSAHGQAGWKSWLYPLSVDLLTVAAYRKILAARRDHDPAGLAWFSFLLGLAASLAANVVDSWTAASAGRVLAVAIGVWPAVALLVCTLLGHDHAATTPETSSAPAPVAAPVPATQPAPAPAPVVPEPAADQDTVPVTAPASSLAPAAAALPSVPPPLLTWARTLADQHQAKHGTPIDLDALRTLLGPRIAEPLARAIHRALTPELAGA